MNKTLGVFLLLALIVGLLLPVPVQADEPSPVSASGIITDISESTEFSAGVSTNVKVVNRSIYGSFTSGDLSGSFTLTYKANIDLTTQSGNFNGTLTTSNYTFKVSGRINPYVLIPVDGSPGAFYCQSISQGYWSLKGDEYGTGTFNAIIYFVPTPDSHVDYVLPGSTFNLSGYWNK